MRELFELELGQRFPTPQIDRAGEQVLARRVVACGKCLASLDRELLEPIDVELTRLDTQDIAGSRRRQALLAEALAQTRDVDLDVLRRRLRCLTEQLVSQSVDGDGFVRM